MKKMSDFSIRLLETPEEMTLVEELQRVVWPGSETDVVPAHMLLTAAHNGGLMIGAFDGDQLVGMVFGFPGIEIVPDGPRPKHCSHMAGVLPEYRDSGLGFLLKRAQWQMVRHQGIDHVTWTYDPLLSRNAHLNIAKLGAVCNTYLREVYGDMRDGLNTGLVSDRFQVDWWVFTRRVERRLGKHSRGHFDLSNFIAADILPLYPVRTLTSGWIAPPETYPNPRSRIILVEIPADFLLLKASDMFLAREWRMFSRHIFEQSFAEGYIITDFVFDTQGDHPRSFYVLSHGESTLDGISSEE